MVNVIFTFNGTNIVIQCKNEDKMKDICQKFISKVGIDINLISFLYNRKQINLELTYNEIANSLNKNRKEINILVYDQEKSKDIICPKCYENCRIKINNYKIKLYECKNKHEVNNILLNEYYNTQNDLNIICNNCNNNKNETYNKHFYRCITCNSNLCKLCKLIHNNKHIIIDYNKKNYICNLHNYSYILYCNKCKLNLCIKCEMNHKNHEKIYFLTNSFLLLNIIKILFQIKKK